MTVPPLQESERALIARADEVVRLAREVLHGREHSGTLLLAMAAYEAARAEESS